MCVILTTSANGNVSMAVLNASIGNLLGILITPLLLLFLLNVHSSISFLEVIIKLSVKVVVPLAIGQFFSVSSHIIFRQFLQGKFSILR